MCERASISDRITGNIFIGEFIFRVKPKIKGYGGRLGLKNPLKTSSAQTEFFF